MPQVTGRESATAWEPALFNAGQLSQREYRHRRDKSTASELARLEASPEFQGWARKSRRRQQIKLLGSFVALVLLCGSTLVLSTWLVQQLPPHLRLLAADPALSELSLQHRADMKVVHEETVVQLNTALKDLQAAQQLAEELRSNLTHQKWIAEREIKELKHSVKYNRDRLATTLNTCGPAQPGLWLSAQAGIGLAAAIMYALIRWRLAALSARLLHGKVAALRRQAEEQEERLESQARLVKSLQHVLVLLSAACRQLEGQAPTTASTLAAPARKEALRAAESAVRERCPEEVGAPWAADGVAGKVERAPVVVEVQAVC